MISNTNRRNDTINPKYAKFLENFESFMINRLKSEIYINPESQQIKAEVPCISATIGFGPQKAPKITKLTQETSAIYIEFFRSFSLIPSSSNVLPKAITKNIANIPENTDPI